MNILFQIVNLCYFLFILPFSHFNRKQLSGTYQCQALLWVPEILGGENRPKNPAFTSYIQIGKWTVKTDNKNKSSTLTHKLCSFPEKKGRSISENLRNQHLHLRKASPVVKCTPKISGMFVPHARIQCPQTWSVYFVLNRSAYWEPGLLTNPTGPWSGHIRGSLDANVVEEAQMLQKCNWAALFGTWRWPRACWYCCLSGLVSFMPLTGWPWGGWSQPWRPWAGLGSATEPVDKPAPLFEDWFPIHNSAMTERPFLRKPNEMNYERVF